MAVGLFWNKFRQLIRQLAREMAFAQLLLVASSLAYTTILSIVPLLALSFAIFHAFGGMDKAYNQIVPFILQNLAEGSSDEVVTLLKEFISNAHASALGLGGFIGLVLTSMTMLSSIEGAINRIWNVPIRRGWFQRISAYWIFITLGPLALAVALGIATSSSVPLSNLAPGGTGIFLVTVLGFTVVFKWVPDCPVRWRFALIGGILVAILWNILKQGYQLYLHRVVTYDKIYGSLGAIPILLLWIYIAWFAVLAGAAVTAALQKIRSE